MIKRSFGFALVFLILTSVLVSAPVLAASESEINLLSDLGILEDESGLRIIEKDFSRGDFAKVLSMLDSYGAEGQASEEYASTLASDIAGNSNSAAICEMIERGIMDAPDKLFNPQAAVTQDDAVKALVKILGYEPVAAERGSSQLAYTTLATQLGIFKGVNIADRNKITQAEMAEMIHNAMGVPFYVGETIIRPTDRCFFDLWELTQYDGKILANSNLGIGVDKVGYGNVNIDGSVYESQVLIEDVLVGSTVEFYTRLIEGREVVVSVTGDKRANTIVIDAKDIAGLKEIPSGFEIVYDENKKLRIEKSAFMIVNNKIVSPSMELFEAFRSGSVTLIDTNGNGDYDLGHMSLLIWGIAEGVSSDGDSIVVRTGNVASKITLDNVGTVEVYMGNKVSELGKISRNMPVGMACDKFTINNGKVEFDFANADTVKLFASNRTESGLIDRKTDEKVYLNEMDYRFSDAYFEFVQSGYLSPINVGDAVQLYFDRYGEIVYYEPEQTLSTMKYGYLIDAAVETTGFSSELLFKILDVSGNIGVYRTQGQKFVLDGEKTAVNAANAVYYVDGNEIDFTRRQLIRYLAAENIIRSVDTGVVRSGVEDEKSSLYQCTDFDFYADNQASTRITRGNVGREFVIADDCVVFTDSEYMDASAPNEKRFLVGGPSTFGSGIYHISAYDANDMNEVSCIVYYRQYGKTTGTGDSTRLSMDHNAAGCYVIDSIIQRLDDNGEEGWGITVANYTGKQSYFVSPSDLSLYEARDTSWDGNDKLTLYECDPEQLTSVLASGDIIRFTTTLDGKIDYIEKFFDFDVNKANYPVLDIGGQSHGFVNVEKNSGASLMYSDGDMYADPQTTTYVLKYRPEMQQVPVYNVKKGRVDFYTPADLPTAAKGNKVKAFLRYYDFTWIYDYILYLYE